jgi:hypothetical protein
MALVIDHDRRMKFPAGVLEKWVVDPTTGCWVWHGAVNSDGYGLVSHGPRKTRRVVKAHRFWYVRLSRPLLAGEELDHLCRRRRCVNPGHLQPVSRLTNVRRQRLAYMPPAELTKLDEADRAGLFAMLADGVPYGQVADELGISMPEVVWYARNTSAPAVDALAFDFEVAS